MAAKGNQTLYRPLTTSEIQREIEKDPIVRRHFQGVFPIDMLPFTLLPRPSSLIVNWDPHNEGGTHWMAIYFPKHDYQPALFFDSYGRPPLDDRLLSFLHRNTKGHWYNSTLNLQGQDTSVCGWWTLLFLKLLSRGYHLSDLYSLFKDNHGKVNDRLLLKYLRKFK